MKIRNIITFFAIALIFAGCAATESAVNNSQSMLEDNESAYAIVVVGTDLPGNYKAMNLNIFVDGKPLSGRGVALKGFKPAAILGLPAGAYSIVGADRRAYCAWKISEKCVKNGGLTIVYPVTLYASPLNFNCEKVMDWDRGFFTPVNVRFPYDLWYCNAPVFNITNPGIYYLGEMTVSAVDRKERKCVNDSFVINHETNPEKFKKFLVEHGLDSAEFYDFSDKWVKLRGIDFFDRVRGKK